LNLEIEFKSNFVQNCVLRLKLYHLTLLEILARVAN